MESSLRNADGVIIVFDLTNDASFREVYDWILRARKQLDEDSDQDGRVPMVVVGNKLDLCNECGDSERVVSTEEARDFAR